MSAVALVTDCERPALGAARGEGEETGRSAQDSCFRSTGAGCLPGGGRDQFKQRALDMMPFLSETPHNRNPRNDRKAGSQSNRVCKFAQHGGFGFARKEMQTNEIEPTMNGSNRKKQRKMMGNTTGRKDVDWKAHRVEVCEAHPGSIRRECRKRWTGPTVL